MMMTNTFYLDKDLFIGSSVKDLIDLLIVSSTCGLVVGMWGHYVSSSCSNLDRYRVPLYVQGNTTYIKIYIQYLFIYYLMSK